MDVSLLVFLILLNGAFAMAEMALAASRKARLQVMVESGETGARAALDLHDNPNKYLSTVQIGITSIGVLNGIVGEAAFAQPLAHWLHHSVHLPISYAGGAATGLVVVIITVATIIFGELVPKRLGQMFPEPIARRIAWPMNALSAATRPVVMFLGAATEAVLRVMGVRAKASPSVTEEEIAAQLEEGVDAGVIEEQEHQMVRNVFRLDERQISSMMIPRAEIVWLDASLPMARLIDTMSRNGHSRYPVCRGGLDDVVGVLQAHRLVSPLALGQEVNITECLVPPVFVPETLSGMELLEHLRQSDTELVFVVDEYGSVQGIITERDVLEAITGEFAASTGQDAWAVQRSDGSWLMDGLIPATELKDRLELKVLPDEDRGRYNTLAGLIMMLLGRVPEVTDEVSFEGWRFEVMDMDGKRIDKVWVSRLPEPKED